MVERKMPLGFRQPRTLKIDKASVSKAHAFCFDFHAYQTIKASTTIFEIHISIA